MMDASTQSLIDTLSDLAVEARRLREYAESMSDGARGTGEPIREDDWKRLRRLAQDVRMASFCVLALEPGQTNVGRCK